MRRKLGLAYAVEILTARRLGPGDDAAHPPQVGPCAIGENEGSQSGAPRCSKNLSLTVSFAPLSTPPSQWFLPGPERLLGGAQRGVSLATGTFTGESRRNPPAGRSCLSISTQY
jgi:hypothetical protein